MLFEAFVVQAGFSPKLRGRNNQTRKIVHYGRFETSKPCEGYEPSQGSGSSSLNDESYTTNASFCIAIVPALAHSLNGSNCSLAGSAAIPSHSDRGADSGVALIILQLEIFKNKVKNRTPVRVETHAWQGERLA